MDPYEQIRVLTAALKATEASRKAAWAQLYAERKKVCKAFDIPEAKCLTYVYDPELGCVEVNNE